MLQSDNSLQIILLLTLTVVLSAAVCSIVFLPENSRIFEYRNEKNLQIQILFVGDLMFDRGIRYYAFKNGGNEFIFEKIEKLLAQNDLIVANLEGPITDNKSVSIATAPGSTNNYFFTFDPSLTTTLFNKNIRLLNLGNNHILNFGSEGLKSTERYLDQANIGFFGAPGDARSIIKNVKGVNIATINYNEFYGDTKKEQLNVVNEIKKIRSDLDIVVVFCHWGIEYKKEPTQAQKDLARKFIDAGADLVIGSHPHVIQTTEEYKNKRIYYSLGNFIFDQHFSEDVRNGLGVIVKIDQKTKKLEFSEVNFYLDTNGQTVLK